MTYLSLNNQVDFVARALDSASRLRVSTPLTLFEHNNQAGTSPFKWDKLTSGTGSIVDGSTGGTTLSTGGTAAGAQAARAQRWYSRYQVGKSLYLGMSFNFGTGVTGCSKRIGYYDVNNGVYLEQNGTTINITVRSNSSGSPVDTPTPQSSWNIDQLNGSGPSGITFNPSGPQDWRVDFFGSFGMRFYFYGNGKFWLVHTIENANVTPGSQVPPDPTSVNLTVRQEIINVATAASAGSFTVYNANVVSEGAVEENPQYAFGTGNGPNTRTITTRTPLVSVQANTLLPNGIRNNGQAIPFSLDVYGASPCYYELVVNPTLTGAAFASVSPLSILNADVAATALTGGITIFSGYLSGTSATGRATVISTVELNFPLVYSSLQNVQDILSLVVTPLTGTGSMAAAGSLAWVEYY
jgi:hypothetical protein